MIVKFMLLSYDLNALHNLASSLYFGSLLQFLINSYRNWPGLFHGGHLVYTVFADVYSRVKELWKIQMHICISSESFSTESSFRGSRHQ